MLSSPSQSTAFSVPEPGSRPQRPRDRARRSRIRRGAQGLLGRDRPPARGHRPGRRHQRRLARRLARAGDRTGARRAQRRPQPGRSWRLRGRNRARPSGPAGDRHRSRAAHRVGRDGSDRGRVHGRGGEPRARDRVRRFGVGRNRRDHARRWRRVPGSQARPHDRRPARRRGRDRRRPAPARRRREPSRSLLGDPWRGRQLRGCDALQVPPARGRHDRRWAADPAGQARRDRIVRSRGGGSAGGALGDRQCDAGTPDAVHPPRTSRSPRRSWRRSPIPRAARPASGPWCRFGGSRSRSPTWSRRCPIPSSTRPSRRTFTRGPRFAGSSSTPSIEAWRRRSSTTSRSRRRRWR